MLRRIAWLAQLMVVGKDMSNPLMAENLLEILKDLVSPSSPKSLTNSLSWNGRTTKIHVSIFLVK